ncbi:hypothetical protein FOH10_11760 [Nocardia otitidiscaviarum]|uniref:Uncharacterized protein n=1 Tax=Nocardia otitidiscaviarum TaxID=1823 RepID=A0A516NK67_9NOCA|nr:hypothetical protein [Nocardia otitidiscaviarum]MCP9619305.1 hypothetical protein [Nocardia otitidiscaviarum]QDP79292.1 hypothetical protein FOH10_11760 [Nocardia otitidiscaviarum]
MSAGVVEYLLACVVALATIALRLTVWRTRHGSRPFTIALSLLLPGIVLRHPLLLERDWLPQDSFAGTYLTNFTDLVGDLLIVAAGAYLFTVVARAWGREDLRPWIVRVFTAGGMVMVVLWAVSDAPRTQTKYVGYLGGAAQVYSYVAAGLVLVANLAVLLSVVAARLPRGMRLSLIPLGLAALLGVSESLLRIGSHIAPGVLAAPRDIVGWQLSVAMIVLYALSGLIGHIAYGRVVGESERAVR